MKTKIRIYLILAFLAVFSKGNSQNIENFLRPYADKIVENTAFEFIGLDAGTPPATRSGRVESERIA